MGIFKKRDGTEVPTRIGTSGAGRGRVVNAKTGKPLSKEIPCETPDGIHDQNNLEITVDDDEITRCSRCGVPSLHCKHGQ